VVKPKQTAPNDWLNMLYGRYSQYLPFHPRPKKNQTRKPKISYYQIIGIVGEYLVGDLDMFGTWLLFFHSVGNNHPS